MHQHKASLTGSGTGRMFVNSKGSQMTFDWFFEDASGNILQTAPSGVNINFSRRLLNSDRYDENLNLTSEKLESFANNPFTASVESIPNFFSVTDLIQFEVVGLAQDVTFHLNIHQV